MATSQTSICNLALTYIGQRPISDITEKSENAQRCGIIWDAVRQAVLNDHNWNFATKIMPLGLLSEIIPGWAYTYSYPSDCLFVNKVFNSNDVPINGIPITPMYDPNYPQNPLLKPQSYRIMQSSQSNGMIIATNVYQAYIQYVLDVSDVSQFDSSFVDAFSYALAVKLTQSLTGDKDKVSMMAQFYKLSLDSAKVTNLAENNTLQSIPESDYVMSR